MTLAFLLGQLYLLARLGLKLWFLASQTVLFQSAHPWTAGLTAVLATERATLE
ncbi:MAG: hypothetical protein HY653_06150 [Acidobacteria bacterium]|nr:hypothetical protein [Acidobacteriota bacterium]